MKKIVIALFVVLLIGLSSGTVAAVTPTQVTIVPETQSVGIGDSFQVDVWIVPAEGIAGGQASVSFSSILQVDSVVEGTFLAQSGHSVYFFPGTVSGVIDDIYGVIAAKGVAVFTPGSLATITFTALEEGTATISVYDIVLGNLLALPVAVSPTSGTVTVYPDWDVNMDGEHNVLDMISVYQHFMETGEVHWIREDVNRDGEINVLDMILVGQHWTG